MVAVVEEVVEGWMGVGEVVFRGGVGVAEGWDLGIVVVDVDREI